jgi:hypothetical protein
MLPIIEAVVRDCTTVSTKVRPEPSNQCAKDEKEVEQNSRRVGAKVINLNLYSADEIEGEGADEEEEHDVDLMNLLTDEQLGIDRD